MYEPENLSQTRVVNSEKTVKKIINNLDNSNLHYTMSVCLDSQAHVVNYKKHKISHEQGLRVLCLKRNRLGNKFAQEL